MMHDSCLDGCPFYEVIAKQLKAYFNVPLKLSVFSIFRKFSYLLLLPIVPKTCFLPLAELACFIVSNSYPLLLM